VPLFVAEPSKQGLGRKLLKILYDSAQFSYDQSQCAADQTTGKVAIVVFATESSKEFYEKCGYRALLPPENITKLADVSVKHRQSPLSDVLTHFSDTKHPIQLIPNTTVMLTFPHRHALLISGSLRMQGQFKCLDKSNENNLVGAFIHIPFTTHLKKLLSVDKDLLDHMKHSIYRTTNIDLNILALVTARLDDGEYDVLCSIDRHGHEQRAKLRNLITNASSNEKGYLFRRICLNVPSPSTLSLT
jgi:hypothetical protein